VKAALAVEDDELLPSEGEGRPGLLVAPRVLPELNTLLRDGLIDDPPVIAKGSRGANETGYIRDGFRSELDGLRDAISKGRDWIAGFESRERETTGIPTLKIRFHPVHGYAIEVSKANLNRVPEHYERKQTLANAERFTTTELRREEQSVRGGTERAAALEREIFEELRQAMLEQAAEIGQAADQAATLDALAALAEVARRDGWMRPVVDESVDLEIDAGRHPVIEPLLAARGGEEFVPNETRLGADETQILVLTGPNMSGKSTYLRQVALIVLLAQMGSFVPAKRARVGVVDRVFTRVGASDRLARGESTVMVEMRETAEILNSASRHSLVILDEIGRGTSTFDGLSIAWAVAEYLHDAPGLAARTLFATHYHELADLARTKARVDNAHFEAREWGDEVIFLRRLVPGAANRSYGIQVARLAGLPDAVIDRARIILDNLEGEELDERGRPRLAGPRGADEPAGDDQLGLFQSAPERRALPEEGRGEEREALRLLEQTDLNRTTPLEALDLLSQMVTILRGEGES
jgi:DNA mismatch repair protein MutS